MRTNYLAAHLCSTAFFFFNDTAPPEIYTLSLHDALPISPPPPRWRPARRWRRSPGRLAGRSRGRLGARSEEHTSELQSQSNLVCRLLLEKKKKQQTEIRTKQRAAHRGSTDSDVFIVTNHR